MDLLCFLDDRPRFIGYFYETAAATFAETKRLSDVLHRLVV